MHPYAIFYLGQERFAIKNLLAERLICGLIRYFILIDQARIATDVVVDDTILVQFDLPVSTYTVVELTEKMRIKVARVNLRT